MKFKLSFLYPLLLVAILFGIHYFDSMTLFILLVVGIIPILHKPLFIAPVYFISSMSGSFFVLPTNELGAISRYLSILLILSLVYSIISKKQLSNKSIIPNSLVIILICFNFLSCTFSLTGSLNSFFLMLQNILIVFLFAKYRDKNYKELFGLLYYSTWLTFLLLLIEISLLGFNLYSLEGRFSVNDDVNQNRLAMMLVQMGVIIFVPMLYNTTRFFKGISIITLPIVISLIVATGSRTALIAYLLSLFVVYVFLYSKFSFRKMIILSSIFFIIICLWEFLQENVSFMYRFSLDNVIESGGTHRLTSINLLINYIIPENLFFGVGLGGENTIASLQRFGNNLKPAHNFVIDMYTQVGLVGFILYFILFMVVFKEILKMKNIDYIIYMPLLIVLSSFINGIGETVFMEKFFWNGLALGSFFLLNIKNSNQLNKQ